MPAPKPPVISIFPSFIRLRPGMDYDQAFTMGPSHFSVQACARDKTAERIKKLVYSGNTMPSVLLNAIFCFPDFLGCIQSLCQIR